MEEKYLLVIDIGSKNITAAIGKIENSEIEITGIGTAPSEGIQRGVIVHLDKTVKTIREAVSRAENDAGINEKDAIIGISGPYLKSMNASGVYNRPRYNEEITEIDVQYAVEAAKSSVNFPDREIIHLTPQSYSVDNQTDIISKPIGMIGKKITLNAHIATSSITAAQNIIRSVNFAGYNVKELVPNFAASGYSTLTADEKKMGVILADIGEVTIDLSLYINGSVIHSSVNILGGFNITRDLSVCLRIPFKEAERIKKEYGNLLSSNSDDKEIEVAALGSKRKKNVKISDINNIISARAKEIFDIIAYDVINSKMDNVIPVGMILTGGTSKLKGIAGFAEAMLKMPVRLGIPKFVKGRKEVIENPENAAVIGLLLYSMENADFSANNISKKRDFFDANIFTSAFSNLKTLKEKFF